MDLQPHKWERKYTGTGRTVWECSECFRYGGFAEKKCSEPSKHPGCNAEALQATPAIPAGYRLVPVERDGDVTYRGFYKLVEEMGELLTVLGKLGPFPSGEHPDGAGDLRPRIQDELADVMAAARYFAKEGSFNHGELDARSAKKVAKFNEWGLTGITMVDQIDSTPSNAAPTGGG